MRLREFDVRDVLPIRRFAAADLADVVVLAGRNGVGKTRLVEALVTLFRAPLSSPNIRLVIEATCEEERTIWGKSVLNTSDSADTGRLMSTLQQSRRRSSWKSSVLQFESDRSIQQVQPYVFNWDYSDPFEENTSWESTFSGLRSRFQDTVHSLFRKVRSHREAIARRAEGLRSEGATSMALDWPDPLEAFKVAFSQLLAPKQLVDPDPQRQQLEYELEGQRFFISTLSSGEREVVNIVFDFLLRNPEDCVVLFDEPELHLHPELSYRLLQTLRLVGKRNQFIFCTHSPDIITASLDQSVLFVGPAGDGTFNQAVPVRPDDDANQALTLLGQSVGIVALGRKLVLIEGVAASLDKQTYGTILRNRFPDLVLVPTGGKGLITSFDRLLSNVLERTIWGVQFFMLCDGDTVPALATPAEMEARSRGRLRVLPRYHIENYFLDEQVLARVFEGMEPEDSWLRDPARIGARLKSIAQQHAAYATALIVSAELRANMGAVDVMPSGVHGRNPDELVALFQQAASTERARVTNQLDATAVEELVRRTALRVSGAIEGGEWKRLVPGRSVFNTFASTAQLAPARLKQMYLLEVCNSGPHAFDEIIAIFSQFSSSGAGD